MVARKPARPRARAKAATANVARGEHMLTLGGVPYRLRPTFAAACAIEEAFGTSLLGVAEMAGEYRLSFDDLGVILAEWIKAGAAPDDKLTANVTAEGLASQIYEDGMLKVLGVILVLLKASINGGHTATGEVRPVTMTTETL